MKSIKKEYSNRIEYRNEQGDYHRIDGPAVEYNHGFKVWWINGKLHKEDGPAVEGNNGYKEWFLNDIEYSEDDYYQELAKIKLKRILDL